MDEFVLLCALGGEGETAEEVDHIAGGEGADPNVAVYDPHDISLCFSIAPAHVPDLRIRPEIAGRPIAT